VEHDARHTQELEARVHLARAQQRRGLELEHARLGVEAKGVGEALQLEAEGGLGLARGQRHLQLRAVA
jgi:hypothetical protein